MSSNPLTGRSTFHPLQVLRVDSSARSENSITRQLTDLLIAQWRNNGHALDITRRDVAQGIPFVTEEWVSANFTDPTQRSQTQQDVLTYSDHLVQEIQKADVLVIGAPIYNFGIPATLKAWIDMIARARLTFYYDENGPVGLLTGKRAYVILASGGTPIGSDIDFASAYLRHALAFLGITDTQFIAADRLMQQGETARTRAIAQIASLVNPATGLAA